jgi:hypothetical protein
MGSAPGRWCGQFSRQCTSQFVGRFAVLFTRQFSVRFTRPFAVRFTHRFIGRADSIAGSGTAAGLGSTDAVPSRQGPEHGW